MEGDKYFELAVNSIDTINIEYTDIYPLAISRPDLIFTEEIGLVVNDPPTALSGLVLRENEIFGTIKRDNRIEIQLPDEPGDLMWHEGSTASLDTTYLYGDSSRIVSNGKVMIVVPKEDFPIGYELHLGSTKIDTVSTRIIEGGDLLFKIRNSSNIYLSSI